MTKIPKIYKIERTNHVLATTNLGMHRLLNPDHHDRQLNKCMDNARIFFFAGLSLSPRKFFFTHVRFYTLLKIFNLTTQRSGKHQNGTFVIFISIISIFKMINSRNTFYGQGFSYINSVEIFSCAPLVGVCY